MNLLEVKNLKTSFFTPSGEVKAVDDVSFNLSKGTVLGIVGESGSGKSVTAYSILQILTPPGRIVGGSIKFRDKELVGASEEEMRRIRGNKISIIFQDPMTSLNPVFTIGNQLMEAILLHTGRNHSQALTAPVKC
jgi:oligopeptide transport system ATP-binding protein